MEPALQSTYGSKSRNLLMIAVISGLGGVLSTYIGYIGNLLNRLVGVPFGAGQFISGLHIYWLLMVACLTGKPGAATAAGLLKGLVEFFTGSTHGIAIIVVGLIQGFVIDLVLFIKIKKNREYPLLTLAIAGGLGAVSNVLVFQLLYFSGASPVYIGIICSAALISGVIFGGYLTHQSLSLLSSMRPGRYSEHQESSPRRKKSIFSRASLVLTVVFFLAFVAGVGYYFKNIYELPWQGITLKVEGRVEQPMEVSLKGYADQMVAIRSELIGKVTTIPEQEYIGVPVRVFLEEARPMPGTKEFKVVATDGYEVTFELEKVLQDDRMLIVEELGNETTLRLVAANYEGGYWVRKVSRFVVR
ncbi:ECF transporter S component [Desulfosporosinus sp. BICA1-9]|uniref:ECF transporter S component n=1 Tax=Desulfosporosinus sp. BICA1-9 TaxID=1531958 RepID=UPI00054B53F0|nr:ECF transporter S component [Desulfosporosinus sp. BICA1-9]KJS49877.1 MAG: hypothetical protein VR66_06045 [Peptococcaceae bacterium BRH_c23]KJS86486.1 MAG: hypothetical protein JL57_16245 [Desulfosporosinus sp. BICA1-9]HBW35576.1 hypothetical protein [Desulfosporosinus sp.]